MTSEQARQLMGIGSPIGEEDESCSASAEYVEELESDLDEARDLLEETADYLSSVLKADKRKKFLSANLRRDLSSHEDEIRQFCDQWLEVAGEEDDGVMFA